MSRDREVRCGECIDDIARIMFLNDNRENYKEATIVGDVIFDSKLPSECVRRFPS